MKAYKTFLLVLLVVAMLVGMYFLPQLTICGIDLRSVNLLADVEKDTTETNGGEGEGIETPVSEIVTFEDSVPDGMVVIEDFKDSLGIDREMDHFYAALDEVKERPVRIAYFGDSFIEGDILTASLRDLLQEKFGGCGVGFIDIKSQIAGFRTSVVELSSGWEDHNVVDAASKGFNNAMQGINGRYYFPMGLAYIDARGQQSVYPEHLDTMETATVFFTPESGLSMRYSINGEQYKPFYSVPDSIPQSVQARRLKAKMGRISVEVNGRGRFYGIALEGRKGIVLDNFSMRGSVGWHLGYIPQSTINDFARLRHYDLIIMHYGLNMVTPSSKGYEVYCEKFKEGIERFREAYPETSMLIVSVSNRDSRGANGEFQTMRGVVDLVEAQHQMAQDEHVAFWNIQQAMGGSGSMARMQKEGQANRDYTHINFQGGKVIGQLFFDVLMNGKMNYDHRMGKIDLTDDDDNKKAVDFSHPFDMAKLKRMRDKIERG